MKNAAPAAVDTPVVLGPPIKVDPGVDALVKAALEILKPMIAQMATDAMAAEAAQAQALATAAAAAAAAAAAHGAVNDAVLATLVWPAMAKPYCDMMKTWVRAEIRLYDQGESQGTREGANP